MKSREGETFGRFATKSLGLHQRFVQMLNCFYFLVCILAEKGDGLPFRHLLFDVRTRCRYRVLPLLAALHRASPEIPEGVITSSERVVPVALSKCQGSIVAQSFD